MVRGTRVSKASTRSGMHARFSTNIDRERDRSSKSTKHAGLGRSGPARCHAHWRRIEVCRMFLGIEEEECGRLGEGLGNPLPWR